MREGDGRGKQFLKRKKVEASRVLGWVFPNSTGDKVEGRTGITRKRTPLGRARKWRNESIGTIKYLGGCGPLFLLLGEEKTPPGNLRGGFSFSWWKSREEENSGG